MVTTGLPWLDAILMGVGFSAILGGIVWGLLALVDRLVGDRIAAWLFRSPRREWPEPTAAELLAAIEQIARHEATINDLLSR
jgi:ABC-type Fe3+-siderophore transport system permease subunit